MKYTQNTQQGTLFSFDAMKVELPKDNELIRMSEEIDWDAMIEIVGKKYSNTDGRRSMSIRMMIGLEIAKRKYGMSDEDIVEQLRVDMALKVFCGFDSCDHEVPEASSLTVFRKRLDQETLKQMEEVNVRKIMRKVPLRIRHQVIVDSTCVPSNITYPTDSKLLATVWKNLNGSLEKMREGGVSLVIRGKRKTASLIRSFNLKRRKTRKEVIRMNQRLIRMGKRMMDEVMTTMEKHGKKISAKLRKNIRKVIRTAEKILRQQSEMIQSKTRRVKDRIVSFHEPLVRPIFRGKDSSGTEFGPKVRVSVVGGALIQSSGVSNDNISDTRMVRAALKTHRRTFDHDPTELIADRGAHSPKNHALLKRKGIRDGIQYRGRIPINASLAPPATRRRMYRQRAARGEGLIGVFKTRYQGHRNRYRNKNAQAWISFGMIAMNGTWAARHSMAV
jgi:hypothetical protein